MGFYCVFNKVFWLLFGRKNNPHWFDDFKGVCFGEERSELVILWSQIRPYGKKKAFWDTIVWSNRFLGIVFCVFLTERISVLRDCRRCLGGFWLYLSKPEAYKGRGSCYVGIVVFDVFHRLGKSQGDGVRWSWIRSAQGVGQVCLGYAEEL